MQKLESTLILNKEVTESENLSEFFTDYDLQKIGLWVLENYKQDKQSREKWEARTTAAMDLAMQVQKQKTFPWPNCSNIAFPLVTIAALQFHARAYPVIVNGRSVVQCRVPGPDPQGLNAKRAKLISRHMSWQVLEQDESWEEQQDRALLNVAIVGVGWKKSYYNSSLGHNVSEFVSAKDLVVNYWAKSIETALVKTHVIPFYKNDIHERVMRGAYNDCLDSAWYKGPATPGQPSASEAAKDNRAGLNRPEESDDRTPYNILEQHCWIDFDCDGYAEPYIVTVEEQSGQVLRIVARWDRDEDIERTKNGKHIIRIKSREYFTKIPFLPSPDGGIMDYGFGILLGPLNESVNSSINQLFDAGTLSNTAGGFLGRGAKIRGGVYSFEPFSWRNVDASGDDLRKSIFPLPVREPSTVMFNLLSLLIEYTNRISGSTDMLTGENPGQNTPAETSRAMVEQGQKIYSAIFKRIWRSMKGEFKKLFILNAFHLPDRSMFGDSEIRREDYTAGPATVVPAADPLITSDAARFTRVQLLTERAAAVPGYNNDEVEKMFLSELGIDNVDQIYPGQAAMPPPPPDVKVQLQEMKNQVAMAQLEQAKMEFIVTMQETQRLNAAKIMQLTAQADLLEAQAQSEPGKQNVAAFRAGIEAIREQNKTVNDTLDRMMEEMKNGTRTVNSGGASAASMEAGVRGMATPPNDTGIPGITSTQAGIPEGGMG